MKKVILTFVLLIFLGFEGGVRAQGRATDGFFKSNYDEYREDSQFGKMPLLPRTHGYLEDYSAVDPDPVPVGGGLILLTTFGVCYIAAKRKDN